MIYVYDGWALDPTALTASKGSRTVALTPTESALLAVLMQNAGTLVTRKALLHKVWGIDTPLQTRTLDAYIVRLRRKLGLSKKLQSVYRQGYLLLGCGGRQAAPRKGQI